MSEDSIDWQPERPCRPEVQAVVNFICDSLDAQELNYSCEQSDPDNPDAWSFVADDEDDHSTIGLLGWNDERAEVAYAVFDPIRFNHDVAEGFPEDESKCWWSPNSAVMFVQALDGTVSEIITEERKRRLAEIDNERAA